MSNSYAKRLITSSAFTMNKRLPLNGARVKLNNSPRDNIAYFCR